MEIKLLELNIYSCTFKLESVVDTVIRSSPWSVRGADILLRRWPNHVSFEEIQFDSSDFWVQVHHLPPDRLTEDNMTVISKLIGTPVNLPHKATMKNKHLKFICLRVFMDLTKALKTGFFFNRGTLPTVWIQFKYERLSDFCYKCGELGHNVGTCQKTMPHSEGVLDPRYAFRPWLRANLYRLSIMQKSKEVIPVSENLPAEPASTSTLEVLLQETPSPMESPVGAESMKVTYPIRLLSM